MSFNSTSLEFADDVANLCIKHFNCLPKTGKPQVNKEWTSLAAFVMSINSSELNKNSLKVISLSTGTKCLGFSQLNNEGDLVFDSHAEILARRAFIRYLYHHIELMLNKKNSEIFYWDEVNSYIKLKENIKFHFFISHTPCGDASIFPKHDANISNHTLHKRTNEESENKNYKKIKIEDKNSITSMVSQQASMVDIYRTGAKCVKDGIQDPKGEGKDYHATLALRIKPGRGDPTLSMSCSDKIALWNVCGLQGALIMYFLKCPIYMSTIVFAKCPFDIVAAKRALIERLNEIETLPSNYIHYKPEILQSNIIFEFSKEYMENKNIMPCPSSIIWTDVSHKPLDVCVNGKKQGVTKKNLNKPSARIVVCKRLLFEKFLELISKIPNNHKEELFTKKTLTYFDYKKASKNYQLAKSAVFKIFHGWMRKPNSLQQFVCNIKEN